MIKTNKCVIILSEKSSGSSALQNLLTKSPVVKTVTKTRHFENETLYWTKAASILKIPQLNVEGSEVPFEPEVARNELISFLKDNLDNYKPLDDDELIIDGWRRLCIKYSPVFLEKSPHHLYQWSAIKLIIKCIHDLKDVDFLIIGLVRNPMDTIYSQFRRWKSDPDNLQNRWLISYKNLLELKKILKDRLIIIRYEDMVSLHYTLKPVYDFCQIKDIEHNTSYLHNKSIKKWKSDPYFNFSLSNNVIELAEKYGYHKLELENKRSTLKFVFSKLLFKIHQIKLKFKNVIRFILKKLMIWSHK